MLATITRPWIGRRCGALAGPDRAACSSSSSGGWTSSNAQWGSAPRPWSPSRRDPDDRGGRGPPNPNLTGTLRVSAAALRARLGVAGAVSVRNAFSSSRPGSTWTPRQGPVPGGWSAASTPPGGRSSGPRPARPAWDPGRRSGSPGSAGGRPRRPRAQRLSLSAVSAVAGTVATVRPAPAVGAWSSHGASDRADAPVDVRAGAGQQVELGGPVPAPQLPGPGPGLHLRPLRDRTPVGDWGDRP
jgi:hypothetical protein